MKKYRILSGLLAVFALLAGCRAHERKDSVRREAALRPLPDYPFIRYEDNTLQFPSGRADFDTLYHKMDSLLSTGKGKINILHIGGSHVQAGYLSHRLRMNFSTLGDSVMTARGVIFPFRILRTNAPPKLPHRFHRNMGKLPMHQTQRYRYPRTGRSRSQHWCPFRQPEAPAQSERYVRLAFHTTAHTGLCQRHNGISLRHTSRRHLAPTA